MRLLLAGAYRHFIYEEPCARALGKLGLEVVRFAWDSSFRSSVGRLELKYVLPGPYTAALNARLRRSALHHRPDVIFIWRGVSVWPSTVRWLRQHTGARLVAYNNDDPFGPTGDWRLWRWFKAAIPEYDIHFVFRPVNVPEYSNAGARRTHVLPPYYIPEIHRPVTLTPAERQAYGSDVVFIGHWEPDGRVHHLRALVEAGMRVRLFGNNWTRAALGDLYDYFAPIHEVILDDYAKALCGANLCLSFLSRLNRDTYTRRSFEIPACGRVMVSERTPDLCAWYQEDREAVFFSSPDELLAKARLLLADDAQRQAIGAAGRQRCVEDGHDIVSRMQELVRIIGER